MRGQPYALKRDEGKVIDVGVKFVVKGGEGGEGCGAAVLEYVHGRRGGARGSHTHPTEDEMFLCGGGGD